MSPQQAIRERFDEGGAAQSLLGARGEIASRPLDMGYIRDLGYCAAQFLLDGGTAAMVSIQNGRFTPILFTQMVDPSAAGRKCGWWISRRSRTRLRAST